MSLSEEQSAAHREARAGLPRSASSSSALQRGRLSVATPCCLRDILTTGGARYPGQRTPLSIQGCLLPRRGRAGLPRTDWNAVWPISRALVGDRTALNGPQPTVTDPTHALSSPRHVSKKAAAMRSETTLRTHLEKLGRTPVNAHALALVEVGLGVPVRDALGVARVDEAVAAARASARAWKRSERDQRGARQGGPSALADKREGKEGRKESATLTRHR